VLLASSKYPTPHPPHTQPKLVAAEGVMCELDTQLSLLTDAISTLQQQLGEQQDTATAAV